MALERRKDYARAYEAVSRGVALLESGANPRELRFVASKEGVFAVADGIKALLAARVGRKDEASRLIEKAMSIRNKFETRYWRASICYIEGRAGEKRCKHSMKLSLGPRAVRRIPWWA